MAINESLNILRSHGRDAEPVDERLPAEDAGPLDVLAAGQGREAVLAAVRRLKPEYRSVIVLHYFVDLPYEDIADVLEVDAKTVKSRLYSARQVLKDQLAARGVT